MNLYRDEELSKAIDDYIENKTTSKLDDESDELFELAKQISDVKVEIPKEEKSKAYVNMMRKSIKENENMNKKNNKILKSVASITLAGIIGMGAMQTGFAQDMYDKVKEIISLNYVTVRENTTVSNDHLNEDLTDSSQVAQESENEDNYIYLNDLEKAQEYIKFNLKIPSELPEEYEFKNFRFYTGKTEDVSGEYVSLFFNNGKKEFFIIEVLANEDNKFESRGKGIEEITIDGRRAIIDRKGNIDIEIDDVILTLLTKGNISREEAIKVIESIK